MQQVSSIYLAGIREGRSLYNTIIARGETVTRDECQAFADNCAAQLKRGFDSAMKDMFRGERDFWLNKIKESE